MNIRMDAALGAAYHSPQQQARVITEAWAAENMYCVMCGAPRLEHLQNNKPVADLCCPHCRNTFELKSHNGRFGSVIADGAYEPLTEDLRTDGGNFIISTLGGNYWKVMQYRFPYI